MPPSRRYVPFAVLAAAQLLLALVVPSVSPNSTTGLGQSFGTGQTTGFGSGATAGPLASVDPNAPANPTLVGNPKAPASSAVGAASTPGGVRTQPGGAAGQANGTAGQIQGASGDRSHCKGALQFDELQVNPPCVAKFPQGANNGGATYNGVSSKEIRVVYYRVKQNPAVDNLLNASNLGATAQQDKDFLDTAIGFINAKYETYGRTVKADFYQGNCDPSPPDPTCFRDDAKIIAKHFHPFVVIWTSNTNVPEFHDELARAGIISFGGWHFSDQFRTGLRPYNYDLFMGGDKQARLTAEYYCKRLYGKPAAYAGTGSVGVRRKAAILYPDIPIVAGPAQTLLSEMKKCGAADTLAVPYSSNIETAQQQATSIIAKLKSEGVTSVLCFCDPIAPVFITKTATQQAYFPEHVLVGSGLLDYDLLARLYDPPQWAHAFGMSDLAEFQPIEKSDAGIVWREQGAQGPVNGTANTPWGYLALMATGIHLAGPRLDPGTFERAMLSIDVGGWERTHNPQQFLLKFGLGNYTAISDAREAYWDASAPSKIDGKNGSYVATEGGRRFRSGSWTGGDPQVPAGFGK